MEIILGVATMAFALAGLLLDIAGIRRRRPYYAWAAGGVLVMGSAILASGFADQSGSLREQVHLQHVVAGPLMLAGCALLSVYLLLVWRARAEARRANNGQTPQ